MGKMSNLLFMACAAVAGLGTAALVRGQVEVASPNEAGAIRAAAKEYVAAVRRGDVDAMRTMWAPDGDYVDAFGRSTNVRNMFPDRTATPLSSAKSEDSPTAENSLRFITPDVAIEDGTIDVAAPADDSTIAGRFTAVWVKRNGRWLLNSLRETATTPSSSNDNLRSLEWLIGEWTGVTDNGVVLVSSHWSEGGNYIVREIVIRTADGDEAGGTQRIGWDPVTDQIKSWAFDSQGGTGEGCWRQVGESWVVESEEVLADGNKSSTSTVYTPRGEGRFVWEVKRAKVNGVSLPMQRVEFVRAVQD